MKKIVNLEKSYFCFCATAFLFSASSFSVTFSDRFSAMASSGFQSLFLTVIVNCSVSAGSFSSALLKRFSAASSLSTSSSASSGHASIHWGSRWSLGSFGVQRSQAMAFPVSECMVIPPCSQA